VDAIVVIPHDQNHDDDNNDDDEPAADREHLRQGRGGREEWATRGRAGAHIHSGKIVISPIDDVAFDSLSIMMREWSKLFVVNDLGEKKITVLTTPVEVVDLYSPGADDEEHGDVVKSSRVRLLFKKGKTGGRSAYRDKDDVARNNKDEVDGQKDNVDAVKEGGVEVRVEKMSSGELRVIASRCEIEEGTMTKEISEEVIIDSLEKAVSAWRKERALLR
jgi:hypothetical protein